MHLTCTVAARSMHFVVGSTVTPQPGEHGTSLLELLKDLADGLQNFFPQAFTSDISEIMYEKNVLGR